MLAHVYELVSVIHHPFSPPPTIPASSSSDDQTRSFDSSVSVLMPVSSGFAVSSIDPTSGSTISAAAPP